MTGGADPAGRPRVGAATPGQALLAIGLVFVVGVVIGFVLGRTL